MITFERVFALLFGGANPFNDLPLPAVPDAQRHEDSSGPPPATRTESDHDGRLPGTQVTDTGSAAAPDDAPLADAPAVHRVASAAERLRGRDFAELSAAELRELVSLMREMSLAVPPRRTRRYRRARNGKRPDLRGTLRQARRSGGEAIRLSRRAPGSGLAASSCCATSPAPWRLTPARCSCSCTACTAARSAAAGSWDTTGPRCSASPPG